jgi:zinc/manganese transport system permease protein
MFTTLIALPFAQHALIAATLIALISGLIGPFVASRDMAFAVHGAAELAFPSAAAGLLIANDAVNGALIGSLVVATAIGLLGEKQSERNTAIGVILAFGLGLGVLLLSYYHGFAAEATNILFGNILSVSWHDIIVLSAIAFVVTAVLALIYRPLLFASIDADVATARGLRTRLLGLAITPAAAARRLTANPLRVTGLSVLFALVAADGGLLLSLQYDTIKASVFITFISFGLYVLCRACDALRRFGSGRDTRRISAA